MKMMKVRQHTLHIHHWMHDVMFTTIIIINRQTYGGSFHFFEFSFHEIINKSVGFPGSFLKIYITAQQVSDILFLLFKLYNTGFHSH